MFESLPLTVRSVKATEARLQRIYDAAKLGLKGDSLALSAGMLPIEFRQLCQLDPLAEMAAMKGKADGEVEHATVLSEASLAGDAKAALAILQHVHGWAAKQITESTSTVTVEIKNLLSERDERIRGVVYEHDRPAAIDSPEDATGGALLQPTEVRDVGVLVGGG